MFDRILLPLDGSKLAERSIPHAIFLARLFNAKIFLLHILDPAQFHDSLRSIEPFNWQLQKAEADLYLHGVSNKIREHQLQVTYEILEGRTAESILDYAHQEKMDLIVLSTHGASGFSRWNMSSVVTKVIEKAYLPLFLIRSYQETVADEADWETKFSPTASFLYRRILLPIDSSRRAEHVLPVATAFAEGVALANSQEKQPKIILTAVIKPPDLPLPSPYPTEINQNIISLMQVSREAVSEYLATLGSRLSTPCDIRVVENTSVPAAIHNLVDEEEIDLVILSAHGQTGPVSWPYGSIAQNYIEHGDKHVLLIQDTHPAQVRPTAAETAAEKYGRR